ncbi:MAG: hypothetical protein AB1716_02855 [Planctomycetota bacterium]
MLRTRGDRPRPELVLSEAAHEQSGSNAIDVAPATEAAARPGWLRVLLAPVLDLFCPASAARTLASASRTAFAAVYAVSVLGYGIVLVALVLWDAMLEDVFVPTAPTAMPSMPTTMTATNMALFLGGQYERRMRTAGEVWRAWHAAPGGFGPAEWIVLLTVMLAPLLVFAVALLIFPWLHRAGPVGRSAARATRIATGVLWPLAVLTVVCAAVFIIAEDAQAAAATFGPQALEPGVLFALAIALSAWAVTLWVRRAALSYPAPAPEPPPPRCEGCGYDLTHRPAEDRCPECGLSCAASLDPRLDRAGSPWAAAHNSDNWWRTLRAVVSGPGAFYRALRVREPRAADTGFARVNLIAILCGAGVWAVLAVMILSVQHGPPPLEPDDLLLAGMMVAVMLLSGLLACWLAQLALGALVVGCWLIRGELADYAWATKVIAYETAFLWSFTLYWGVLGLTFCIEEDWISELLAVRPSGSAEFVVFCGGTVVLLGVWLVRYEKAYRAIRWSNF